MPNPSPPRPIGITISNGSNGLKAIFRNLTSGGFESVVLDQNKQAICDVANFTNGAVAGDVIQVEIHGRELGSTQVTLVEGGGGQVASITSSDDASAAVSL